MLHFLLVITVCAPVANCKKRIARSNLFRVMALAARTPFARAEIFGFVNSWLSLTYHTKQVAIMIHGTIVKTRKFKWNVSVIWKKRITVLQSPHSELSKGPTLNPPALGEVGSVVTLDWGAPSLETPFKMAPPKKSSQTYTLSIFSRNPLMKTQIFAPLSRRP